jgi:porphobilinogen synthase
MSHPIDRPRRLRRTAALRRLVRETDVLPRHLVMPLFVEHGTAVRRPIASMPGQSRWSPDTVGDVAAECASLGIPAVLLFGVPDTKDATGSAAWDDDGVVQRAIRAVRAAAPDVAIIADLCLCEYTDHGHCGVFEQGQVRNDATLPLYARVAVSYARAGADLVAPSGMMDGTVAALRTALDADGFTDTAILAYAVKYASAFYGPFRDAAESAPATGDRRGYQMDPANAREALLEARLDDDQGADILMVKPAGTYLDVIARVRALTTRPLAAYQVSGEYALLKVGAERGLVDGDASMWESVRAIRRAGADIVITYFALDLARAHRDRGAT